MKSSVLIGEVSPNRKGDGGGGQTPPHTTPTAQIGFGLFSSPFRGEEDDLMHSPGLPPEGSAVIF